MVLQWVLLQNTEKHKGTKSHGSISHKVQANYVSTHHFIWIIYRAVGVFPLVKFKFNLKEKSLFTHTEPLIWNCFPHILQWLSWQHLGNNTVLQHKNIMSHLRWNGNFDLTLTILPGWRIITHILLAAAIFKSFPLSIAIIITVGRCLCCTHYVSSAETLHKNADGFLLTHWGRCGSLILHWF